VSAPHDTLPMNLLTANTPSLALAEYLLNPDGVLKKVGMMNPEEEDRSIITHQGEQVLVGKVERLRSSLPPQQCMICYDHSTVYSALGCGHTFCNDCYSTFLEHKIADEGHSCIFARCPHGECNLLVSDQMVRSLLPEGEKLQQWRRAALLERSFVDENPNIKWCPASDCTCAVKASKGQLGVRCLGKHRFCFDCMLDDHRPCTCDDLKRWLIKCKDDSETYNWLMSNTKSCPKCGTSIEKNGGCNHITCKNGSCKHEWCWVCLGPWKDHSGSYYSCNMYNPDEERKAEVEDKKDHSRAALERYLHYYTRFTNHDQSLKMETEAKIKTEEKVKEMEMEGSNTWMDCQYLVEANEALHECRYSLRYTYVYAFYLDKTSNLKASSVDLKLATHAKHSLSPCASCLQANFEMQQSELERQTEELAGYLERDVKDIKRTDVVHCFQMAKKRLTNLLEIVDKGEEKDDNGQGSSTG
jgi:ariadne-1